MALYNILHTYDYNMYVRLLGVKNEIELNKAVLKSEQMRNNGYCKSIGNHTCELIHSG